MTDVHSVQHLRDEVMRVSQQKLRTLDKFKSRNVLSKPLTEYFEKVDWDRSTYPAWVIDKIAEAMAKGERDRTTAWSASNAWSVTHQCPIRNLYQRFGYLPDTEDEVRGGLESIFIDGQWRHLKWQAILLTTGLVDEIEQTYWSDDKLVRGTTDGEKTGKYGVEVKGTHDNQFKQIVKSRYPMGKHVAQAWCYMWLSGLDEWYILYENKNTQDWIELPIGKDDKYRLGYSVFGKDTAALTYWEWLSLFQASIDGIHQLLDAVVDSGTSPIAEIPEVDFEFSRSIPKVCFNLQTEAVGKGHVPTNEELANIPCPWRYTCHVRKTPPLPMDGDALSGLVVPDPRGVQTIPVEMPRRRRGRPPAEVRASRIGRRSPSDRSS